MDDILKDDELGEVDLPLDDEIETKKKGLLDDDVESIENLVEEEEPDVEEPFDDVNPL